MFPTHLLGALAQIAALPPGSEQERAVLARWKGRQGGEALPKHLAEAADGLAAALLSLARSEEGLGELCQLVREPGGEAVLAWCGASARRRDVAFARIFEALARERGRAPVEEAARARVLEGPLLDALACVPLLGDGLQLREPLNAQARARIEILLWEAGACAMEIPALGRWVFASSQTFDEMIWHPAHGDLRGRVLGARCLEICACAMPDDPELLGRTLQLLQPLLLHPEPLVWIHAARALGRLTGEVPQLEGTLLDWVLSETQILRQRALTAFASLPAKRLKYLGSQLVPILASRDEDPWVLAAIAAASPYLFFERRDLWEKLARRILAGDGGAVTARALARGLAVLWRRGERAPEVEATLRELREIARFARTDNLEEARRWNEVRVATDPIEQAERDPLDLEVGLDNLVRQAAQYDDDEADGRAARLAASFVSTFQEARKAALAAASTRQRAAAMNAMESCARSFALRLWAPLLATHPHGDPVPEPDLGQAWKLMSTTPAEILDEVKERRQGGAFNAEVDPTLEILALRLGGYALDACGEDTRLGPGRGPTAHDTCLWLRKLEALSDENHEPTPALRGALSSLFWRLVDSTRGTALGEVDDVAWLGPFAGWWGLVIERPAMLQQLGTALPMMNRGALQECCDHAEALRRAIGSGAPNGNWGADAGEALVLLNAEESELFYALAGLAEALGHFASAAGHRPDLEALCTDLVLASHKLHAALADPVKALRNVEGQQEISLAPQATENIPRVTALMARAIRARQPTLLDVWLASLDPVTSSLVEGALQGAIARTPPPPPAPKKSEPRVIQGYELVKPLGQGGIGFVWLVRKPGADRLFVLKIPKADALAAATESEREGILASFIEEAKALAGLYHPNVANIIDRGVADGAPFLVLEYLIGADLKAYATARLMTLPELRQIVLETCAGLSALHGAGLVHRDIKPANLWLRLPLAQGEIFDPTRHRDPLLTPPLSSVVIDFGMVRSIRVPQASAGRFIAGTPGYIAPEQVLDPVELDPRADLYSLAGCIYNLTTGRAFFDDIQSERDRIIAHLRRDPFEDATRLRPFPASVAKLLRAATARAPGDRPTPMQFGREFIAAVG
ncbi:MAG: serine/threonine protein kinase [Polyangiaceae bacterium]|jgi:serine/threonine-protein kinase|nr:serine/threonine protein kinase [Polyangiaceae bacterium]